MAVPNRILSALLLCVCLTQVASNDALSCALPMEDSEMLQVASSQPFAAPTAAFMQLSAQPQPMMSPMIATQQYMQQPVFLPPAYAPQLQFGQAFSQRPPLGQPPISLLQAEPSNTREADEAARNAKDDSLRQKAEDLSAQLTTQRDRQEEDAKELNHRARHDLDDQMLALAQMKQIWKLELNQSIQEGFRKTTQLDQQREERTRLALEFGQLAASHRTKLERLKLQLVEAREARGVAERHESSLAQRLRELNATTLALMEQNATAYHLLENLTAKARDVEQSLALAQGDQAQADHQLLGAEALIELTSSQQQVLEVKFNASAEFRTRQLMNTTAEIQRELERQMQALRDRILSIQAEENQVRADAQARLVELEKAADAQVAVQRSQAQEEIQRLQKQYSEEATLAREAVRTELAGQVRKAKSDASVAKALAEATGRETREKLAAVEQQVAKEVQSAHDSVAGLARVEQLAQGWAMPTAASALGSNVPRLPTAGVQAAERPH